MNYLLLALSCLCFVHSQVHANNVNPQFIHIKVSGLACDSCAHDLQKKLSENSSVEYASVDLDKGLIDIKLKEANQLDDSYLKKILLEAGYNIDNISRESK